MALKIKRIKVICHGCKSPDAEKIYFNFHDPIVNKDISCVTHYCEQCPRTEVFETFWTDKMIIRLIELRIQGNTYQQINDSINKEFGTNFTLTNTPHGWKGAVVKKLEHLKENSIEWIGYTDDTLLNRDTIRMLSQKKQNKNRYFKRDGLMKWERPTYHSEREDIL